MSKFDLSNWLYYKKNTLVLKYRAILKYYFFKRFDVRIGHNVFIKRGRGKHSFGRDLVVSDNALFEVFGRSASITVGDKCFLSYGVIIVCTVSITIGNNVWIGEYCSIRDATHSFSVNAPLGTVPDWHEPIKIGNNVWIGRGCIILPGTVIEDNIVVGANSVVKGHLKANSMYGGCPVRFIKTVDS